MYVTDEIYDLIISRLSGNEEPGEGEKLDRWLEESARNNIEYRRICSAFYGAKWTDMRETIARPGLQPRHAPGRRKHLRTGLKIAAAACVVFAAAISGLLLIGDFTETDGPVGWKDEGVSVVRSDGSVIEFETGLESEFSDNGVDIRSDGTVITYSGNLPPTVDPATFNTIRVPRSGTGRVTLPDGTTVVLNSESELRFPLTFADTVREVHLTGEACFNVEKHDGIPFFVHTGPVSVEVLGTVFNVSVYDGEPATVTLAEGTVRAVKGGTSALLSPGQQLRIYSGDGSWTTAEVDAHKLISWTEGTFMFETMPLERLMANIARWYDIEYVFRDDDLRGLTFTGGFRRSDDVMDILNMIGEVKKVDFSLKNRKITIEKKK